MVGVNEKWEFVLKTNVTKESKTEESSKDKMCAWIELFEDSSSIKGIEKKRMNSKEEIPRLPKISSRIKKIHEQMRRDQNPLTYVEVLKRRTIILVDKYTKILTKGKVLQ